MNIDRSRFLVLTAALAAATGAAGCTIIDERGKDAGGTADDTAVATDTLVAADTAPGSDASDGGGDGSVKDGGTDATDATLDADGETAPTCDDTVGTLKSCSTITGTGCTFAIDWCGTFATNYKTAVANKAIDCIATNSLPTCEGILFDFQSCVDDALAAACPDPTAATVCQKWKDDCATAGTPVDSTFTVEGCQKLVNGLTTTARSTVATCFVTEGGCGTVTSLDGCVGGL
jgi:hypothetical protein